MYFKTLIFLFLLQISLLHTKIITVSPNGSIPSIEVAAYYAEPGDTIEIKGGIYTERQNIWGWRNEYSTADYGWSQCVMTWAWDYNRGEMSRNVTWQRNNIHDSWGIDIILCEGCTAKENNITNAFSVLL